MLWLAIMFLWLNIGRIIDESNLDKQEKKTTQNQPIFIIHALNNHAPARCEQQHAIKIPCSISP